MPELPILSRPIPSTGEMMPVVGLGTWPVFDVGAGESARGPLREVVRLLLDAGRVNDRQFADVRPGGGGDR